MRRSVRRSFALDATLEPGRFCSLVPPTRILAPFAQLVCNSIRALGATIRIPSIWTPTFERLMVMSQKSARAVCAVSTGTAAVTALSPNRRFVVAFESIAEHDASFIKRSTPIIAQQVQVRLLRGRVVAVARPLLFSIGSLPLGGISRCSRAIKTWEVKGL